jgi:hypothetical protein
MHFTLKEHQANEPYASFSPFHVGLYPMHYLPAAHQTTLISTQSQQPLMDSQ